MRFHLKCLHSLPDPSLFNSIMLGLCCLLQGQEGAVERTLRQSFLISADMAHALHPNYTDKHDSLMAPAFQGGLVLKHNNNQRYATNAISAALFRCARFSWAAYMLVQQCCVIDS